MMKSNPRCFPHYVPVSFGTSQESEELFIWTGRAKSTIELAEGRCIGRGLFKEDLCDS